MKDLLTIGGTKLHSRLFLGTGKFSANTLMPQTITAAESQVVTVALRRVNPQQQAENILNYIPPETILLPNTSGARTAEEAIRIARMGRAMGCGNWVKIEIITDNIYYAPSLVTQELSLPGRTDFLTSPGFASISGYTLYPSNNTTYGFPITLVPVMEYVDNSRSTNIYY